MNHFLRKAGVLAAAIAISTSLCAASFASRAAAEPAASVTFDFSGAGLNGYSATKIYTGTGSRVRLTPGWSWKGYNADAVPLRLSVQRDTGSGWSNVSSTQALATGGVDVTVPTYKTSAKQKSVRYRLLSSAYVDGDVQVTNNAFSSPVTVVYENQKKYTGYAKEMYGYMSRYCPQAAVHSVNLIDRNSGLAGQTSGSSQFIMVKASERAKPVSYRKAIALHECGHVRQWLNYGSSPEGDKIAQAQEAKYFVNDSAPKKLRGRSPYSAAIATSRFAAVEHAADCSSMSLNPKGYLGYGGYCNANELKRAKALMLGKRYDLKAGSRP